MTFLKKKSPRSKLHELEPHFHCSVIGTCLTLTDLRKMSRKLKIPSTVTDHELHRTFVEIASESSYANRRVQKYLDRKYQQIIRQFAKASDLKTMWQEAIKNGEVVGPYWALVTHPNVSDTLLEEVYGEIHMLSHLSGASIRIDMQELSTLRKRTKILEKQLADTFINTQTRLKEKDDMIQTLNKRLAAMESEKQQHNFQIVHQNPLVGQLKKHVGKLSTKLTVEQTHTKRLEVHVDKWKHLEECNIHLEQKLVQTSQERDSLETSLSHLLNTTCSESCSQCPNLCGRCILFVGGRNNQCSHFRHLVEQQNGRFIHHDGGLEESRLQLGNILSQADAVLCPLDTISHDAMNKIKRHCKHNTKQLVMMPHSSLSAFVKGLNEVDV